MFTVVVKQQHNNNNCTCILAIFILTVESVKITQAFQMRCCRRLLNVSYNDHITNEDVRKNPAAIGEHNEQRLSVSSGLAKTIDPPRHNERKKKRQKEEEREDNIKECKRWTLPVLIINKAAENKMRWIEVIAVPSLVLY